MEEKKQEKHNHEIIHKFINADTSSCSNYCLILSFIEALLSGCMFEIVNQHKGQISFKNLYSHKPYISTLNDILTIAASTELPLTNLTHENNSISSALDAIHKHSETEIISPFKKEIILQACRLYAFEQDPLKDIASQEEFMWYLANNQDKLTHLDGFDETQCNNSDYLDSYWLLLKKRNETRKEFFRIHKQIIGTFEHNNSIILDEEIITLCNKPLYIDYLSLKKQYKELQKRYKASLLYQKCSVS